ncbi:Protein O-mannosyltransferase 2 [Tilletia horrida]|uniref:Dolichyl-phosphate-mannose--protein mannosyltransferase n=1 Tax=Tilletia horrida TaxID=155126 RepID=A0AAN6GRM8_9BASI|nr:Protein O-mannosyltransferase 2 [Tilletia horrida]KAK0553324.1 Protein O-mannosyltransferase 2 [Tilletia horrida]KAK0567709.1 Protein O-mannosyltransferase 2 [Tilletia horrida]
MSQRRVPSSSHHPPPDSTAHEYLDPSDSATANAEETALRFGTRTPSPAPPPSHTHTHIHYEQPSSSSSASASATLPHFSPSSSSSQSKYFAMNSSSAAAAAANEPLLPALPGEDKFAEKVQAAHASAHGTTAQLYAGAGLEPIRENTRNRYAKMIPVHRKPRTPIEHLRHLFAQEWFVVSLYTALSLFTRLYRIGRSPTVIWDEAHFGKFGSYYLKHQFYFDVHPPLGKMLVGLAGLLSGYNGHYDFESGASYPQDVNYYVMRIIMALYGVAMVPVAYSTSGALGWNWRARHLLAIMVLCDNAWLVISRFILLDSMLLCFTFTTVHGMVKFHQYQHRPFSDMWWFWLIFTGASIGCVSSVKWVGLFVMALVGLYTVEDLWDKFGDLRMPVRTYARHWCARALCLIVLPAIIYMISFKIHFVLLSHSGPGDAQMSSLFQARLKGNDFGKNPVEAAYGSKVTFKNMGYGGGLLHSHVQSYPTGSQQQQVTCYHYRDDNNDFFIHPTHEAVKADPSLKLESWNTSSTPVRFLQNGDTIRLVHAMTQRNLHSHPVPAPVTKENHEVSCYGDLEVGDSNDHWIVEVVDDLNTGKPKPGQHVRSLSTRLRFRHKNLGCYLFASTALLPQWGWKQVEVSCIKENNPKDDHTHWNIESHWNPKLPAGNPTHYRSPFFRDFIHLNVAMMTSNNALIPDADKFDILASGPYEWPFLWNGLRMNSWADDSTKYYLVGNVIVWWGSTLSLPVFLAVLAWYLARIQRRHADLSPADFNQFVFVGKVGMVGWFLHYLPFLVMGRVTYIHHYLPTLYFAVIIYVHLLDHFLWNDSTARYRVRTASLPAGAGAHPLATPPTRQSSLPDEKSNGSAGGATTTAAAPLRVPVSAAVKNLTFAFVGGAVVGLFLWMHGTYMGMDGPMKKWWGMKFRKTWNIY